MYTPTVAIFAALLASSAQALNMPSISTDDGTMLLEAAKFVMKDTGFPFSEHDIAKDSSVVAATDRVSVLEDEVKILKAENLILTDAKKVTDEVTKAFGPSDKYLAAPTLVGLGNKGLLEFGNHGTLSGLKWNHEYTFDASIDGVESNRFIRVGIPEQKQNGKMGSDIEFDVTNGDLSIKMTVKNSFGSVTSVASNVVDLAATTTTTQTTTTQTTTTKTQTTTTQTTTKYVPKKHFFTYTGKHQTWTVPAGVKVVEVYIWGASGSTMRKPLIGGGGGYTEGSLQVRPGQKFQLTVGGCGKKMGTSSNSGGGGGLSGVFIGGAWNQGAAVIVAGGGGGAGTSFAGGGGGGTVGQRGSGNSEGPWGGGGTNGGYGGTQSAAGRCPGGYSGSGEMCLRNKQGLSRGGVHGSTMYGGAGTGCDQTGMGGFGGGGHGGGNSGTNGGGGGGGYFGGGGGGGSPNSGAGGGGSGFIKGHSQCSVSKAQTVAANGPLVPQTGTLYKELRVKIGYEAGKPMPDDDKTKCTGHGGIVMIY